MRAGKLKDVIEIHRLMESVDIYGADIQTFKFIKQTFADVYTTKEDRNITNYAEYYPTIVTIVTRIYHDILDTDRINYKGAMYRILSVNSNTIKQLTEIKAEKIKE